MHPPDWILSEFAVLPAHGDLDCRHCPWRIFYKWSVTPAQPWLVPVPSFVLGTGGGVVVPAGLVAEPMWPLSATGEPFLRAEIAGQPSYPCPGKILFSLVVRLH